MAEGAVKYGRIVEVRPQDYAQMIECDDGSIDWLCAIDRVAAGRVGDRVKLTYRRWSGGALWFGSRMEDGA